MHRRRRRLVIYLISGGASAIAEKPITAGISLADVVETYKALVHSGAPIAEINAIRKHLSALKGGRLARAAAPSYQASVLVSDVPEGSLDALASGPTMPDTTTVADCYAIVKRYKLLKRLPRQCASPVRTRAVGGDTQAERSRLCALPLHHGPFERHGGELPRSNGAVLKASPSRWTIVATTGTTNAPPIICWAGCGSCDEAYRALA